ncbi:MAG: hypothetical protein Q8K37_02645 [Alphaproteobacteria bacterium]|nr:hypothetical protein [Alphaproteobacteria bacterium]
MKSFVLFIAICLMSHVAMAFENERPVFSSHEKVPELSNYNNDEDDNDADSEAEELDDEIYVDEDDTTSPLGKFFQESVTACSVM